jgi:catechol 2,3-dioxygenase-like lactoylglutathione lyase family enzyme
MRLEVDHLVLVAGDAERTVAFYVEVLGGTAHRLDEWRRGETLYPSVLFGDFKFNVHPLDLDGGPRAAAPTIGAADFCLRFPGPVDDAIAQLTAAGVTIEHGPTQEECARGLRTSVYFRDPDGSLLEFACEPELPL